MSSARFVKSTVCDQRIMRRAKCPTADQDGAGDEARASRAAAEAAGAEAGGEDEKADEATGMRPHVAGVEKVAGTNVPEVQAGVQVRVLRLLLQLWPRPRLCR